MRELLDVQESHRGEIKDGVSNSSIRNRNNVDSDIQSESLSTQKVDFRTVDKNVSFLSILAKNCCSGP